MFNAQLEDYVITEYMDTILGSIFCFCRMQQKSVLCIKMHLKDDGFPEAAFTEGNA